MDTAHSPTRCQVYLHPTAATNPQAVIDVQEATGRLICVTDGRALLKAKPATTLPALDDFGPWDGGSAA